MRENICILQYLRQKICSQHCFVKGETRHPAIQQQQCSTETSHQIIPSSDKILYELTSCGTKGTDGPTQSSCERAYTGYQHDITVTNGVQHIYIPTNGTYRITGNPKNCNHGNCNFVE